MSSGQLRQWPQVAEDGCTMMWKTDIRANIPPPVLVCYQLHPGDPGAIYNTAQIETLQSILTETRVTVRITRHCRSPDGRLAGHVAHVDREIGVRVGHVASVAPQSARVLSVVAASLCTVHGTVDGCRQIGTPITCNQHWVLWSLRRRLLV